MNSNSIFYVLKFAGSRHSKYATRDDGGFLSWVVTAVEKAMRFDSVGAALAKLQDNAGRYGCVTGIYGQIVRVEEVRTPGSKSRVERELTELPQLKNAKFALRWPASCHVRETLYVKRLSPGNGTGQYGSLAEAYLYDSIKSALGALQTAVRGAGTTYNTGIDLVAVTEESAPDTVTYTETVLA